MKLSSVLFLATAALTGTACSLVTVPVKVAGGIVETTVTTTGDIVSAPFKAIGGSDRNTKDTNNNKDTQDKEQGSDAGSTEGSKPKQ
jgi:hypothetical protein